jgi:streptogramin lyase
MSFRVFASDGISDVSFNGPAYLAFDNSGNLYVSNSNDNNILKIDYTGTSGLVFANSNTSDISFNGPDGLAFDNSGNLYVSNYTDNNILKINPTGTSVSVFANSNTSDISFNNPQGLAFDTSGNLYVSNNVGSNCILKINPTGTSVSLFASSSNPGGENFDYPSGLAFDTSGNLYVSNYIKNNILKINPTGTSVSVFADTSDASFNNPWGLVFDTSDYLYVTNTSSNNILKSIDIVCFNEDTKILCLNHSLEEEYVPIQDLKKGDLVKTYLHGYRKVDLTHKGVLFNNPNKWNQCMYKMEKTEENGILEDLIVTGGHSILVDSISEEEQERLDKLGLSDFPVQYKFDDKYLLLVSASDHFVPLTDNKKYTYYHLTLENNGDGNQQFGIWANGVLTETTCKNYLLSKI